MRILFVNLYYPPDGGASAHLLGQLTEDLARSHHVRVITGRPSYLGPPNDAAPSDVEVVRVRAPRLGQGGVARRTCNYLGFAALASIQACRGPRPDVIVTMTNPPFIGVVGVLAAARYRSRFVCISHDVFPDLAIALGWLSNRLLEWGWRRLNRLVRARAACIVVVGRDMAHRLQAQGVDQAKLAYIPAWIEPQVIDPAAIQVLRAEHGWEGRFVVMHAGNVGLAQNVTVLADLAERVIEAPEVLIVVLGDGPARRELAGTIRDRGLRNIEFLPALPRRRAQALMAGADLHVVSLVPGLWGCSAPSKTYGIMAAGRPFVAAVDAGSEPARLAEEFGCGRWVPAGDAAALAAAVLDLRGEPLEQMGERGRRAAESHFQREQLTAECARLLEAIAAGG